MPTALLPLASGEVVLGPALNEEIVRLLPDGRIDSRFRPGRLEGRFGRSGERKIDLFIEQPDGRLLVAGAFERFEERPVPSLMRLNRDGSLDESFTPPADLELNRSTMAIARRVALQSDGKVLLISAQGLIRLLPDGRRDVAYAPPLAANFNVVGFALASGDRLYVGLGREQAITRLLPDGTEDPTFVRRAAEVGSFLSLYVLADGRLLVNTARLLSGRPQGLVWSLVRWREDGSTDPSFPALPVPLNTVPASDGTLYLPDGSFVTPAGAIVRWNLGFGQFDSSFNTLRFPGVFGPDGRLFLYGGFSFHHGVASSRVVRLNRVPVGSTEVEQPPRILAAWSDASHLTLGERTVLHVAAVAPGPVTYEWRRHAPNGALSSTVRTRVPEYAFAPRSSVEQGNYTVRVLNSAGEAISAPIAIALDPAELRIASQPDRVTLAPGRFGSLHVETSPYVRLTQAIWSRDGNFLARYPNPQATNYPRALENGANDVWLELGPIESGHAGTYTVTLTDSAGHTVPSRPITVTVAETPRFVNMSTRTFVGEGERAAVLGLVIPPGSSRTLFVRGIGPTLSQFGIAGALADARLELFDPTGRLMTTNDHWREHGAGLTQPGAFELALDSKDAMIVNGGLAPGAYTVRLSGPPGTTGIGLIEIYDVDNRSDRFVNISTRVFVPSSASPAIAGFALRGDTAKRVLVRAAGPALGAFGVASPLANPRMEVRDATGALIAANDDWSQQPEADVVLRSSSSVGAFAFAANSRDAALVLTLPAGNFTAVVSGAAPNESGVALLEIYELP